MAWYSSHEVRFRGRLVRITTRYACYQDAVVVKGKPLDLSDDSRDSKRLEKLFRRWLKQGKIIDEAPDC